MKEQLLNLLSNCDKFYLECDGLSRVIGYILYRNNIKYQSFKGYVNFNGKQFYPHFWVVSEGNIIDYCLRMWFGESAPHGILQIIKLDKYNHGTFFKIDKDNIEYGGDIVNLDINDSLFKILTGISYNEWKEK